MTQKYLLIASVVLTASCGGERSADETALTQNLTYYGDAKAIVDTRCATCHRAGDIGPFPLTTFDEVRAFAGAVRFSVLNETMPPWPPSDDCNEYVGNIDLTLSERETLLAWLDAGAPEGDLEQAPSTNDEDHPLGFESDISLQLPEPYTPTREPDDYRCQLIPWPAAETRFVTGLRVRPDQRAIVHHVIAFLAGPDQVAQYQAYDDAEEGPGYTCYGGPTPSDGAGSLGSVDAATLLATLSRLGISLSDLRAGTVSEDELEALLSELGGGAGTASFTSIGSWVPGAPAGPFPAGTGIRVEPGSMIVAQVHYNTLSSQPVPDQSTIEIATASSVERPATILAAVDLGWISNGLLGEPMTIPAGVDNVRHNTSLSFDSTLVARARRELGLEDDAPLVIHSANHHMHELGTQIRSEVRHADGTSTCMLDIPDWDFGWQGAYPLKEPVTLRQGDRIWMGCTWDNTAANQPVIDGEVREPQDVSWGEGTSDEMCLGGFYVTAE